MRNGKKYDFEGEGFVIKDNFSQYADNKSVLVKDANLEVPPVVSILIPTYKRVNTLRETLDSCIKQETNFSYLIIITDSNSERGDETEKYIETIDDDRIKYYKYERDMNAIGNRNRAFELSETQYSIMIHDDDILFPHFVHTMMNIVLKYPQIDILYPYKDEWYQCDGEQCPQERIVGNKRVFRLSLFDFAGENKGFPTGFVVKTSVVRYLGGWDVNFSPSSDWVFNVKALLNNVKIYYYNQPMFAYRWNENVTREIDTMNKLMEINSQLIRAICNQKVLLKWIYPNVLGDFIHGMSYVVERICPNYSISRVFEYFNKDDLNSTFVREKIYHVYKHYIIRTFRYVTRLAV